MYCRHEAVVSMISGEPQKRMSGRMFAFIDICINVLPIKKQLGFAYASGSHVFGIFVSPNFGTSCDG